MRNAIIKLNPILDKKKEGNYMNYSALFKNFLKEVGAACQYKNLDAPFKAFAIVATIPFWIIFGVLVAVKYVNLFLFNCFASSCDYLEGWVNETKKGVYHATEAVIYFIAIPYIFFIRCLLSLFSVVFYLFWFLTMCFAYIATLGGIRWQPFIANAKYDNITVKATTNKTAGNTIVLIGFVLFCLYIIFYIVTRFTYDYTLYRITNICDYLYSLFMVISVPIAFKHKAIEGGVAYEEKAEEEQETTEEYEEEFPEF